MWREGRAVRRGARAADEQRRGVGRGRGGREGGDRNATELVPRTGLAGRRGMDEIGFGVEDVAPARRALFELAVSQADQDVDFAANRDAWLEALWSQLAELLGWDPGPWDAYLPSEVMAT